MIESSPELLVADRAVYKTNWICEKWSEDAVDFARRWCDKHGITHLPAHGVEEFELIQRGPIDKIVSEILGRPIYKSVFVPEYVPVTEGIPSAFLAMIVGEAEIIEEVEGNLLLNAGIQRWQDLAMIATVLTNQTATNTWSNANAQLGVGDSSTAEAATQTALQAATNKLFKGMNATFPSRSNQTVSFQSDFLTGEANFAWAEWAASQGAGTTLLNRKVASLGTKASGTWTLTAQVTIS